MGMPVLAYISLAQWEARPRGRRRLHEQCFTVLVEARQAENFGVAGWTIRGWRCYAHAVRPARQAPGTVALGQNLIEPARYSSKTDRPAQVNLYLAI